MKDAAAGMELGSSVTHVRAIAPGLREHVVDDEGYPIDLIDLLTWLGESKRLVALVTLVVAAASIAYALMLTPTFTARTSLLPPGTRQQADSLATLAALGGLTESVGLPGKPPAEFYLTLLKSDSVLRGLDEHFSLRGRYEVKTNEALRKVFPQYVRALVDKKTGVISVEVDDSDPKFAAELANALVNEMAKVLSRLAVTEAQKRRLFFEERLKDAKEHLVMAEVALQRAQEKSGVIALDKQTESLIGVAVRLRAAISDREVQLKVLRTSSTVQNADVVRLTTEIGALRSDLARMESRQGDSGGVATVLVGNLPESAIGFVRASRELKIQEALMEGIMRQYELAKLDEARQGRLPQQIDEATPPDFKSKPSRALLVAGFTLFGLLGSTAWVLIRRFAALARDEDPSGVGAWLAMKNAWRLRR